MGQNTNSVIKLSLVFFISLLSFSIGTYVGKKYSDNQHKLAALEPKKGSHDNNSEEAANAETNSHEANTEQAALEGNSHEAATVAEGHAQAEETNHKASSHEEKTASHDKAEKAASAASHTAGHSSKTLTDAEVAKIAEEFANDHKNTDSDEKEIKTISAKPNPTLSRPQTLTQNAVENLKKMETRNKETQRDPASLKPTTPVTPMQFTVQVGSFPTEEEASKLTHSLQTKGYKTTFVPAQVNGKTWYRVNVGLFDSAKEAQDYKKDFLEKTNFSSAIVQKINQ